VLYPFCSNHDCRDDANPSGALVMDSAGALWGTTENADGENGVVFNLEQSGARWQESVVHRFCRPTCEDGYAPSGGLVADASGRFYGTDQFGGTGDQGIGAGTAFLLSGGSFRTIYEFCAETGCTDGMLPVGTLLVDPGGALFGVTTMGGESGQQGTIFELTP
jgi:hypothetical protein